MKIFAVALIFTLVAISQSNAGLTEEQREKLKSHKEDCLTSSAVSVEVVEHTKKGEFADDPKLKEFLFCLAKKTGFVNEAGEFQIDVMKTKIGASLGEKEAEEVVVACTEHTKETGLLTSFELAKCLYEKSHHHFVLAHD